MNFDNASDLKSLDEWCSLNWNMCLRRCIEGSGYMFFHECCFSFSRRGFHKRSGHAEEMTVSIHKMRDLKRCLDERDFIEWIKTKIKKRIEQGKIIFFPTINCLHTEVLNQMELKEMSNSQLLGKRFRELEEQV